MKRSWTETIAVPDKGEFIIRLDGRPVKRPNGQVLSVPFQALAEGIAAEWAATGPNFTADDLPLTRLATTAQDRVRMNRAEIIAQLADYGMNDLICYRAADQPSLAEREKEMWQPWLNWADRHLGVRLKTTSGIVPIEQSSESEQVFSAILNEMDVYQLAGLGVIVPVLGSLVLGLAVESGVLAPEAACECAYLEELWQEAHWGSDDEAVMRRREAAQDVAVSARFVILCRP